MEIYNYIGDNAPNYRIELSGGDDIKQILKTKAYKNTSNVAPPIKKDGEYIIANINNEGKLQLDIFKTNKFLYGDFEPDDIIVYDEIPNMNTSLYPIKPENMKYARKSIMSTVLDSGEIQIYLQLQDETRSTGFTIAGFSKSTLKYKSIIYNTNSSKDIVGSQSLGISKPFKTRTGHIVLAILKPYYNTEMKYFYYRIEVFSSADKGLSWKRTFYVGQGYGLSLPFFMNGIFGFGNNGYLMVTHSSLRGKIYELNTDGTLAKIYYEEDSVHFFRRNFTYENIDAQYIIVSGFNHFELYHSTKQDSFMDLAMYAYAEKIPGITIKDGEHLTSRTIDGKMLIITYSLGVTYFTVVEPLKTAINQDVIDITIDRPKNMIGSATIKLNNYMGKYSPDGEINPYKLYPNKEIVIYLGYGENLKKAFTGYIDSIQMNSFPHIITIQCRDTLKLCKDQLLYYNNKYTNTFKNRTPENLFRLLCEAVGVRYGTVEKTGIRLAEVEWNYVSVYDCMEEIAELSGFELSCDENGVLHFREEKPKKNQPIVKSFKEGKNITTLDYSIDDSELYHSVIAQGKKEKEITVKNKKGKKVKKKVEEIISYRDYWEPRNFYNLPKNKILVVDASEADNKTDLKKVVDQALYLMTCRARQVSFEAIADTSLKVGDMIRVEESGSTISEIYRITGIGFDLNNSGYTMTIECYHHRNIKPEEDKEE